MNGYAGFVIVGTILLIAGGCTIITSFMASRTTEHKKDRLLASGLISAGIGSGCLMRVLQTADQQTSAVVLVPLLVLGLIAYFGTVGGLAMLIDSFERRINQRSQRRDPF